MDVLADGDSIHHKQPFAPEPHADAESQADGEPAEECVPRTRASPKRARATPAAPEDEGGASGDVLLSVALDVVGDVVVVGKRSKRDPAVHS